MLLSIIYISALAASVSAAARPWNGTQPRDIGVHCGTTQDAGLNDCNDLINNWDSLYNANSGPLAKNDSNDQPLINCAGSCNFFVAGNLFDEGKALTVVRSGQLRMRLWQKFP